MKRKNKFNLWISLVNSLWQETLSQTGVCCQNWRHFRFLLLVAESSFVCVIGFFSAHNSSYSNKSISVTSEVLPSNFRNCSQKASTCYIHNAGLFTLLKLQNVQCFCYLDSSPPQRATNAVTCGKLLYNSPMKETDFYLPFYFSVKLHVVCPFELGVTSAWCLSYLTWFSFNRHM